MNFRVVQQRHTGIRRPLPCHKAPPLTLTRIPEDVSMLDVGRVHLSVTTRLVRGSDRCSGHWRLMYAPWKWEPQHLGSPSSAP